MEDRPVVHSGNSNDRSIIYEETGDPSTSQNEASRNELSTSGTIVPCSNQNKLVVNQSGSSSTLTNVKMAVTPLQTESITEPIQQCYLKSGLSTVSSSQNVRMENECNIEPKSTSIDSQKVLKNEQNKPNISEQITNIAMSKESSIDAQNEMEIEENEHNTTEVTSTFNNQVLDAEPSCSNSQGSVRGTAVHKNEIVSIETTLEPMDNLLVEQSSTSAVEFVRPKVNLYAEDTGPKLYEVSENLVSKPLIASRLCEAFSDLPIFGKPKSKADLPEFQRNKIKEFVGCGLEDNEFDRLEDYCSPDNLKTGKELSMHITPGQGFYPSELEELHKANKNLDELDDHNLNLVRKLKLRVEKDTKNLYSKRHKYRGTRMKPLNNDDDDNTPVVTLGQPIEPGKELLFIIRWYRPFPYNPKDRFGYRSRHSVFSNNIVMLGRHKLSALRDRVVCANDVDVRVDASDRPDDLPRAAARDMFPSGFLFINNVFYVDTRQGCVDYTAPLRRWARDRGLGDYPCRDMGDVRLDELVVKLGHPEVYVHQGNCEHLFTISEVRVVTARDPLRLSAYPCHTALNQNQTIYCTTCAEFGAKWIVVGCPRVPFDPAFFCEKCFKLYLYKDGKKIGDFKAYLYRGNEINGMKPQG